MPDHREIFVNFKKSSMVGAVAFLDSGGRSVTHIAFSGCLPPDYRDDVDFYSALIDNVLCDCVILDIAEVTITEDTEYAALAFLLGLVLNCPNAVAFVAGTDPENRRFLDRHFGTTAPIHSQLGESLLFAKADSLQQWPFPSRSVELACPQKFS